MTTTKININNSINHVKQLLEIDDNISPALRAAIETIILALQLLVEKQNKNSRNSHKPPSTDHLKKLKTLRQKRKKRNHPGSTINKEKPDKIILHKKRKCDHCGDKLTSENIVDIDSRQIIDIIIKRKVIEHQCETMYCYCGKISSAKFPDSLTRHVQYSDNIKAKVCYLLAAQMIPYNRIASFLETSANIKISEASIFNFLQEAYNRLEFWELAERDKLLKGPVMNVDETGMAVGKTNFWVHSYSNQNSTLLLMHKRRGPQAPYEIDILPQYKGTIIHDCWPSYFKFDVKHGLCGAHLIRELNNAGEIPGQGWAIKLKKILQVACKQVNKRKKRILSNKKFSELSLSYDGLINEGKKTLKVKKRVSGAKGQTKEEKARALLERLEKYKDSFLRFALDPDVPFTNNLAERDLRMCKVKQKVSGCFRSEVGGQIFCRLKSYISSSVKNGIDPDTALKEIFKKS